MYLALPGNPHLIEADAFVRLMFLRILPVAVLALFPDNPHLKI